MNPHTSFNILATLALILLFLLPATHAENLPEDCTFEIVSSGASDCICLEDIAATTIGNSPNIEPSGQTTVSYSWTLITPSRTLIGSTIGFSLPNDGPGNYHVSLTRTLALNGKTCPHTANRTFTVCRGTTTRECETFDITSETDDFEDVEDCIAPGEIKSYQFTYSGLAYEEGWMVTAYGEGDGCGLLSAPYQTTVSAECFWEVLGPRHQTTETGCSLLLDVKEGGLYVVRLTAIYSPRGVNCQIIERSKDIRLNICELKLKSVTFSGDGMKTVLQDNSKPYAREKQWLDKNLDGSAEDPNEHRFPICYKRGSFPEISATFDMAGENENVDIRGVGRDGVLVQGFLDGDSLPSVKSKIGFPDHVDFVKSFRIQWEYKCDGGEEWKQAGISDNRVYLLYEDPAVALYESATQLSCQFASGNPVEGEPLEENQIIDIIEDVWSNGFAPGNALVRKELDGYNIEDETPLRYWGNDPWEMDGCLDVPALLAHPEGKGACNAFALLFLNMIEVQGINRGGKFGIVPASFERSIFAGGTVYPIWRFTAYDMFPFGVKNYKPGIESIADNAGNKNGIADLNELALVLNPVGPRPGQHAPALLTELRGVQGQGCENPKSYFSNHAVVLFEEEIKPFGAVLFDPSYGDKFEGEDKRQALMKLQNNSIGWVVGKMEDIVSGNVSHLVEFPVDGLLFEFKK